MTHTRGRALLHGLVHSISIVPFVACEPNAVIGGWVCASESSETHGDEAKVSDTPVAIEDQWSTGFEDGFCGYSAVDGYCYRHGVSSYQIVTSPVHSGRFAAAFSIDSADVDGGNQTRCVRHGILPTAAYYGAWYYIPTKHTNAENWNLFHFQGRNSLLEQYHNLWDLSLASDPDGELRLSVYNGLTDSNPKMRSAPPIPIGSWFHLEIFLKRAKDMTGEITVYQDGVIAAQVSELVTDDTDWGQWYVGALADAITPTQSTVYVDDVSISASR